MNESGSQGRGPGQAGRYNNTWGSQGRGRGQAGRYNNKWGLRGGRGWRGRGRGGYSNYGNHCRGRGSQGSSQSSQIGLMADPQSNQMPRPKPILRQTTLMEVPSPYQGWKLYFPDEMYSDHSPAVDRIQVFEKYIISWRNLFDLDDIEIKRFFKLDYKELLADENVHRGIPELGAELKDNPERITACMGLAMHQMVYSERVREEENGESERMAQDLSIPIIQARVLNYDRIIPLKHLKANYYGKFVSVKGTVVRVSNIKPLCTKLAFECNGCGTIQSVPLPDGKYIMPSSCPSPECRNRTFFPKRSSSLTETVDWQTIRVQEIMGDDQKEAGRIPRTVDCELTYDLVDSCVPGDVVMVSGVVKVNNTEEGRGRNKDKCMFLLYIHANSVNNTKGGKSGSSSSGIAIDFSMKELYAIEEIHSEKNLFRLLVGSLCPTIYGHEMVKAGLILGLFGGSQKFANDRNRIPVRGDPHILVVGDPGLGKSQMLQAVSNIAPRSVYVCGNTTTTSGLTVTLSKDGGSGDYALEAGALVLSDQGCCCIDEFDKMTSQHQALLEAMEQQSISIAKAGIVCSLPARTSIIAAANPAGGHYNKSKTVSENLRMGSALLSRFDLVFILLDKPDEEMDNILSEHVMALHAGKKSISRVTVTRTNQGGDGNDSILVEETEKSLSERLKLPWTVMETFDPIPNQLLRKYVGYARRYVHPKIGKDAAKIIQEFYLKLRKQCHGQDSTPITTRQLESLIRLTEARARTELREMATKQDAEDVIEIMKYSMRDTFSDQFGWLDFQRSQHGSGMSGRSQPKRFVAALQRVSEQTYNSIFTVQQMRQIAKDIALHVTDFEGLILSLNNQGYLLKKGAKVYQLQTAGY